ncbi:hypothetical protein [Treponema ruminis]|uniref:Uncharacterized protein n=1 Tax=Treponema ruminis TaxID=744515 RepID=A0A7W8LM95_9SPIR|nr:hypothetical protein [Treponema ruminis]MBB5226158.1 hypothetical protein [Treponema ruminis]
MTSEHSSSETHSKPVSQVLPANAVVPYVTQGKDLSPFSYPDLQNLN